MRATQPDPPAGGGAPAAAVATELHRHLERIVEVLEEHVYAGVLTSAGTYRETFTGPGYERMMGRLPPATAAEAEEVWLAAVHADDRDAYRAMDARVAAGERVELTYRVVWPDGQVRHLRERVWPSPGPDGERHVHGVVADVTEHVRDRARLEQMSRTDDLTGVPNRRWFSEQLDEALRAERARGGSVSLLVLDIDRFKQTNDSFGHEAGDDVLVGVARRLRATLGGGGICARWGGEEFVAIAGGIDGDDALREIADDVRRAIADEQIATAAGPLRVTVSVGAVRLPAAEHSVESLVAAADRAMYAAKDRGRNRAVLHDDVDTRDAAAQGDAARLAQTLALAGGMREGMPELHAEQVADLAAKVALAMGGSRALALRCRLGGWLHDIGKLAIPDEILAKPGELDAREWQIMRNHPEIGAQIVSRIPTLVDAAAAIRPHHERFDGTGYPAGLRGDEIPLEARIVACVDAFSAMTMRRAHRTARGPEDALAELRSSAGTYFDPRVVDALSRVLADERARAQRRLQALHEAA
jgi:diguanylate cyclase (GGDEF)-like protein